MTSNALIHKRTKFELSRNNGFIEGAQDIFDLLAQQNNHEPHETEKPDPYVLIDAVTGLYNQHGFSKLFSQELGRVNRGKSQGGILVLIEFENLKLIQEGFGKDAVEKCLQLLGKTISLEVRDMDVAARIGEDELALILPETNKKLILERLQVLALRLNNLSLIWDNQEIQILSSLSLKAYGPGDQPGTLLNKNGGAQSYQF